jgi:hypothetical protein
MIKKLLCGIVLLAIMVGGMASCEHKHTWSEWQIVREATSAEPGIKTRVCERCEETQTINVYLISPTSTNIPPR